ncbi:hypothetical protein [Thermococcus sp. 2319x1]|uniref:hypothetical protein n=1 Tax=Thermococcus sp. 2319x1 TaxID=1674923 RepID=UPI0013960E00|nr:hypothetical protein [Thermococcus sp. 2319x1]
MFEFEGLRRFWERERKSEEERVCEIRGSELPKKNHLRTKSLSNQKSKRTLEVYFIIG